MILLRQHFTESDNFVVLEAFGVNWPDEDLIASAHAEEFQQRYFDVPLRFGHWNKFPEFNFVLHKRSYIMLVLYPW